MNRLGWITTSIILLTAVFSITTASATFNDKDLGEIVQGALREGGKLTHYEMTQIKNFKSIAGVTSPKTNVRVRARTKKTQQRLLLECFSLHGV